VRSRSPDILLLERNIRMLKPGAGRLAIVIPYQILSGPQTRYIRDWLLRNTYLLAVVDLPAETFQPHTGTKTSLLVVQRREEPLQAVDAEEDRPIFMSTPQWIGHDRRGKPVMRRTASGKPTGIVLSDIEDVGDAFQSYLGGGEPADVHPESFTVRVSQVASDPDLRLNARYYRDGDAIDSAVVQSDDWRAVRLGDVTERVFFPTRFKRNYVSPDTPGAVAFFGGANISQLLGETGKYLGPDDPRLEDLLVREGWVLVTRSGSTGIVSTVPQAWDGIAMSEHVIRIVPKPGAVSAGWIHAYLKSSVGQRTLARGVFGSVIDEITPEYVADIKIPVPRDEGVYRQLVSTMEEAEVARQAAITGFTAAIAKVESLLATEATRR
jgi:hypothetical protein